MKIINLWKKLCKKAEAPDSVTWFNPLKNKGVPNKAWNKILREGTGGFSSPKEPLRQDRRIFFNEITIKFVEKEEQIKGLLFEFWNTEKDLKVFEIETYDDLIPGDIVTLEKLEGYFEITVEHANTGEVIQ